MNLSASELETSARDLLGSLGESTQSCLKNCEDKVRQSPLPAVLGAAAVGYVLKIAPLGLLLAALVRVLLLLAKPAIVVFGALKLYEYLKTNRPPSTAPVASDPEPLQDSPVGPTGL